MSTFLYPGCTKLSERSRYNHIRETRRALLAVCIPRIKEMNLHWIFVRIEQKLFKIPIGH